MKSNSSKKRLASDLIEGMQELTEALEASSAISDRFTVRTIKLKLKPIHYSPQDVVNARKLLGASQAIFAEFFGTSVKTVQAWEQGTNPPSGPAARLMEEIRRNPKFFRKRLTEMAETV
ncbi:helix-turn-helix domain-containing protein [Planctomicrobium sp. SH661]|uniref:helix-turn-helix domain-containing protein n=1 Tax=Planctomicrobium sp. SH661 TaxID=3448124 RepID=UPI003F5AF8B1